MQEQEKDAPAPSGLNRELGWLFVFSIVANLLLLTLPLHMIAVYDRVLVSKSGETLLYITLIALVALALLGITEAIRMLVAQRMSARFVMETAAPLFSRIIHVEDTAQPKSKLMRDFYMLKNFLSGRALLGALDLPFTPIFLILLFALHVQLGVVTFCGIALLAGIALAGRRLSHQKGEKAQREQSDAVSFSHAILSRADDIRAMGLFSTFVQRWGSKMESALETTDRTTRVQAFFFGLTRTVRQSLQIVIMAWGAYLVLDGDLSGGVIFAASLISSRAFIPVEQVIASWDSILDAWRAHQNLQRFLALEPPHYTKTLPTATIGDLDVEGLAFNIANGEQTLPILSGIEFSMRSGRILAVIGPTGAGKSTLARVLAGALKPSRGSVRIDDFELQSWSDRRRGDTIGYVPQDCRLFPGSIAENISRFEEFPDEDRIIEAARKASIHAQIAKMPDAYATQVSPDHNTLSGGQQQQIALARAFYAKPRILVLDEPNAHLDQASEDALLATLEAAREDGVSTIFVSQRRSVLKIADHVLALKEGQMVAFKDNEGEWRQRKSDQTASHAVPAVPAHAGKPEVLVNQLNKAFGRSHTGGTVASEKAGAA